MSNWFSYDPIADSYAAVAEPAYFARPAADLVALLQLVPGMRVLDVGSGAGAVAAAAKRSRSSLRIVCVDPALSMLLVARQNITDAAFSLGALPNLPCRSSSFDVVVGAFLLSHIGDRERAVHEMSRILVSGGALGVSSWGRSPAATPAGRAWQEVASRFVDPNFLQQAVSAALPGEGALSSPETVASVLRAASFRSVRAEQRTYDIRLPTETFIQSRLIGAGSRFMQSVLSTQKWEEFRATVRRLLFQTFGPEMRFDVSVNFAVGVRSGAD